MSETVLVRPTVAQLIEALKGFAPDDPVVIVDADTQWTIDRIHVSREPDGVNLFGEYHEMTQPENYLNRKII